MSQLWVWVDRFSLEGLQTLSADESRHVAARRLRMGDELVAFDGRGRCAQAKIVGMNKRAVEIETGEVIEEPAHDPGIRLATAIPKAERLGTMLQMMTQLGLTTWQPLLLTDSAVRKLDVQSARMNRILLESAKVARRARALEVRPLLSLDAALEACESNARLHYGDRQAPDRGLVRSGDALWVFIGPEAGFTSQEIDRLRAAGATPRVLAPHNLRIETAAVAAIAAHCAAVDEEMS